MSPYLYQMHIGHLMTNQVLHVPTKTIRTIHTRPGKLRHITWWLAVGWPGLDKTTRNLILTACQLPTDHDWEAGAPTSPRDLHRGWESIEHPCRENGSLYQASDMARGWTPCWDVANCQYWSVIHHGTILVHLYITKNMRQIIIKCQWTMNPPT